MFHLFHKFPRALDGRGESGELRFFFGAGRAARAALTAASVAAAGQLPCRSVSMHLEKDQDHHGCDAQDHSVDFSTKRYLEVGNDNVFREHVAIHTGTDADSKTIIGSHCMFMNCSHVAHNCRVGNNVILVNGAVIGGYSEVHDNAILSGNVAIHQFCRIGSFAMCSGGSVFSKDVPPFMIVESRNGSPKAVNRVGMRRTGFNMKEINAMCDVLKIFTREGLSVPNAIKKIREEVEMCRPVEIFIEFCENSKRGVVCGKASGRHNDEC